MANITADKAVNHNLYAKINNVVALNSDLKTVRKVFLKGELIGNIYSYIESGGSVYWMIYLSAFDLANQKPVYIKHDSTKLSLPDLKEIVTDIETEQRKKEIEEKGIVPYYIEKYTPYIVGAIVVSFALPAIKKTNKVGMKKDSKKMLIGIGIALAAIYWYKTMRNKGGTPIVSNNDVMDEMPIIAPMVESLAVRTGTNEPATPENDPYNKKIEYVGPFRVNYTQSDDMRIVRGIGKMGINQKTN